MSDEGIPGRGQPRANGDPTSNVFDLVDAAVKRLDDLRTAEAQRMDDLRDQDLRHTAHVSRLQDAAGRERQELNDKLRRAESSRIDAIRAVDVGAVSRAAEVSAAQASTLAAQVSASAEALRGQVAAAATASNIALAAAIEPIQKSIDDLRKTQYESAGQKSQAVESRGSSQWALGLVVSIMFLALAIAGFAISLATR